MVITAMEKFTFGSHNDIDMEIKGSGFLIDGLLGIIIQMYP